MSKNILLTFFYVELNYDKVDLFYRIAYDSLQSPYPSSNIHEMKAIQIIFVLHKLY